MKVCTILLAALALASPALAQRPDWAKRFADAGTDWRASLALGYELASLPDEKGWPILQARWKDSSPDLRQQTMKAFVFQNSPRALSVLNLGATDLSPQVQGWAFAYLKSYALIDFAEDYALYAPWWKKYGERNDVAGSLRDGLEAALDQLKVAPEAKRKPLIERVYEANRSAEGRRLTLVRDRLARPDIKRLIEAWLTEPTGSVSALGLAGMIPPDEAWLRATVAPLLSTRDPLIDESWNRYRQASFVLGKKENAWAYSALEETFRTRIAQKGPNAADEVLPVTEALAELGQARAIPLLIGGLIATEKPSGPAGNDGRYRIGYFGLGRLTGVAWDESHDSAWWRAWWAKNKARYGEQVAALEIPDLRARP